MSEFYSNAKINIGLHIISKREDGYHDIETIFYPVKLFDRLVFYDSNSFIIECDNPEIPVDQNNLIYKARNVLSSYIKKELNVRVVLEKNIPAFAGLGGGSSNAATTLFALNKIFDLNLSENELFKLASQIGSDVSFFLLNKPALAEGRGEILSPLPDFKLDYKILIVFPSIKVSTSWAYSNFKSTKKKIDLRRIKSTSDFKTFMNLIINDFEEIVFNAYPEIAEIKNQMIEAGAIFSSLSGSGSSVYGFFEQSKNLDFLKKYFKKYRVFEC